MLKIGIVGSDNSHAIAFSKLCNLEEALHVTGAQVTHLFGLNEQRNAEVAQAGKIPTVVADPAEMLGQVDAALVVFRHGDLHAKYALPFIKAGVPVFVDKPLAVKVADAKKLLAAAKKAGAPITSFSTVRFAEDTVKFLGELEPEKPLLGGAVYGPADAASEYGGLIFYGIHTVELMLQTFGYDVASVRATRTEKGVVADCVYRDGTPVTLQFIKGLKGFGLMVHTQKRTAYRQLDSGTAYRDGFLIFQKMFETREMPLSPAQLLRPVELMADIVKSYEAKEVVKISAMK